MTADSATYRTWAFTIRPVDYDDVAFWCKALNKYCNCLEWFGGIEYKYNDDGVKDLTSRHIHVGMVLNKEMKRDVIDKWLVRNLEKSPEYMRRSGKDKTNYVKVQKKGLRVWYSWDWVENYVQGEWMENRAPNEGDRARIEPLFPQKGDTGLKSTKSTQTRGTKAAEQIAELWKRDYGDKKPMTGCALVPMYIKYLMYNTKEISLIRPRDLSDMCVHVEGFLSPPELPVPQEIDGKPNEVY
jgi:hypothetical protein